MTQIYFAVETARNSSWILCRMKMWFDESELSLNLSKTKFYNIWESINQLRKETHDKWHRIRKSIENYIPWSINRQVKNHTNYIKGKISKSVVILNKAKDLNQTFLYMLYCFFILPYMTYCVELCGTQNKYTSNLYPLKKSYANHTQNHLQRTNKSIINQTKNTKTSRFD